MGVSKVGERYAVSIGLMKAGSGDKKDQEPVAAAAGTAEIAAADTTAVPVAEEEQPVEGEEAEGKAE